ncbi:MAG: hypothetical protein FWC13_08170 [Oscillospiraceae bacterium]|nr:hypothetical protein [Oscillospiraceae bacterium]
MRIGSNIILRGDEWVEAIDKLKPIIDTFYGVYVISVAIGIFADKQLESLETMHYPDEKFEINSAMLHQNSQVLDLLFKSAIITSENVDIQEDSRMELAFNDDTRVGELENFNQMGFLTKFANYGVTQLAQKITDDPLENIDILNKYMTECANGLVLEDFDIDDFEIDEGDLEGDE